MLFHFFVFLKKSDAKFAAKLKSAVNQKPETDAPQIKPSEQHHQRHGAHQPRH